MSIAIQCQGCMSSLKPTAKACHKCGAKLGKDKSYRVRQKVGGLWRSKTVHSLADAQILEAQWKAEASQASGASLIKKAPTLAQVWEHFNKAHNSRLKDPDNWEYRWRLHVAPELGDKPLNKITPADITALLGKLLTKETPRNAHYHPDPSDPKYCTKRLAVSHAVAIVKLVGRLYNYAIKNQLWSGVSPFKSVELPKFDNKLTQPLADGELDSFLKVLGEWGSAHPRQNVLAALAFTMLLATGKRAGEIFGLTWDDVDMDTGVVTFTIKSKVANHRQNLKMSEFVLAILHRAQDMKHPSSPYVFHTVTGKPISYGAIWKRIKARAGLREALRPHDLRHTFATRLANSGSVDLYTLQKLLGHKQMAMTQRYAHLMDESLKNGLTVASDVIFNK